MELAAIIIAGLSLVVSIIAIAISNASQKKARALSEDNTRLAYGNLELVVRAAIGEATARVATASNEMSVLQYKRKNNNISAEETHTLNHLEGSWGVHVQNMLNAYEEACAKYIDGKIDKERFHKTYRIEIRNLLERQALKKYFDPHTTRYRAIVKVYDEWENLEK